MLVNATAINRSTAILAFMQDEEQLSYKRAYVTTSLSIRDYWRLRKTTWLYVRQVRARPATYLQWYN